jgi:DNA repair exonuclease SbcCD ATPase subunit
MNTITIQRDEMATGKELFKKQIAGMEKIIVQADNALQSKEAEVLEQEKEHIFKLDEKEKEFVQKLEREISVFNNNHKKKIESLIVTYESKLEELKIKFKEEIESKEEELKELAAKNSNKATLMEDTEKKTIDLERKIKELEEDRKKLALDLNDSRSLASSKKEEINTLNTRCSDLENQLLQSDGKADEFSELYKNMKKELDDLRSSNDELRIKANEITPLKNELEKVKFELKGLENEKETRKETDVDVQAIIDEKRILTSKLEALETTVAEKNDEIKTQIQKIEELDSKVKGTTKDEVIVSRVEMSESKYNHVLKFLEKDERVVLLNECQKHSPEPVSFSAIIKNTGLLLFRIQDIVSELINEGYVETTGKNQIKFIKFPWD